jgi:SAM-dependent methyltransferase
MRSPRSWCGTRNGTPLGTVIWSRCAAPKTRSPADEDGRGFEVTSSASMPTVVAQMLTALQIEPGMRVLEIGTGTGYNAALLAHRLGASAVVSVEIGPTVAKHARDALAAAGYGAIRVITGDGAQGYPPGAPYDRVISTAAAAEMPYAWMAQTNPGGLVLTPWGTAYYPVVCCRSPWAPTALPPERSSARPRSCGCAPSASPLHHRPDHARS